MARRSTSTRARRNRTRRLHLAALQLALVGVLVLALPYVMPQSILTAPFKDFALVGGLAILISIVLWVFVSRGAKSEAANTVFANTAISPSNDAKVEGARRTRPTSTATTRMKTSNDLRSTTDETPERPQVWSKEVFAQIEWRRFEAVVETLFAQAGFATKSQSHGADGGVDVWLYAKAKPDDAVGIVQCKHWLSKPVGVDKIRELRGVMAVHNLKRGQFASTAGFTKDAAAFAIANGVNLLGADELLALIGRRSADQQQAVLDIALDGDYWKPTCASCGVKMKERSARESGTAFWGCSNFPKCRQTIRMRSS